MVPVVILCGGQGTRLREETECRPKPLVDVGGKPILWHIMKLYAHSGFAQFVICLGYRQYCSLRTFLCYSVLGSGGPLNGANDCVLANW